MKTTEALSNIKASIENAPRNGRVLIEEGHEAFVNDRIDDAVDLGVDEFDLGL